jgi:hypothetical protein
MSVGINVFRAALLTLSISASSAATADDSATSRESLDEAWWTGPLLAASAATLPKGHVLFEPYIYDVIPYARFDSRGVSHPAPHANDFGSQSYLNYGLADRFTVGLIPRFGYDQVATGVSSSGIGMGDLTLQAQYRLTQFQEGHWLPTISLNVSETLPTGAYDRLSRASDGFGAGAYTTTLSLYSQSYFWIASGHILRTRLNLSYATSDRVKIEDTSVYGTTAGFRGHADPGDAAVVNLAFEYSATRNWVPALDLWYEQDGASRVSGSYSAVGGTVAFQSNLGVSRIFFVAPALEYNFNSRVGIICGVRLVASARNATATVTPVMAINYVY